MRVDLNHIKTKLETKFQPIKLEVLDESYLHKGHAHYKEGHITHIKIKIQPLENARLNNTLLAIHKAIYQTLSEELNSGLHAISIEVI